MFDINAAQKMLKKIRPDDWHTCELEIVVSEKGFVWSILKVMSDHGRSTSTLFSGVGIESLKIVINGKR